MRGILHDFGGVGGDVKSGLDFLFGLDFGLEDGPDPNVDRNICHQTLLFSVRLI